MNYTKLFQVKPVYYTKFSLLHSTKECMACCQATSSHKKAHTRNSHKKHTTNSHNKLTRSSPVLPSQKVSSDPSGSQSTTPSQIHERAIHILPHVKKRSGRTWQTRHREMNGIPDVYRISSQRTNKIAIN